MTSGGIENEIKLRVPDLPQVLSTLVTSGFEITRPRVFEANHVYDTPDGAIRARGELLRLRLAGGRAVLTHKGARLAGPHKARPETETTVGDFDACHDILSSAGFLLVFRYEKYRTEYGKSCISGTITVDETPIGNFLELEGEPAWIDATAAELGFHSADYITGSYGSLYLEYCKKLGKTPGHMVFRQED